MEKLNRIMNNLFWKDKRVLITGHTGFKGSWLALLLMRWGAQVTGYALVPNTKPSLFEAANLAKDIDSWIADIRDYKTLSDMLQRTKPDIVFHMAAQPLVRYSYANPVETYSTNVMGTVNLLEAVRTVDTVRSVVVVTTDKCYENKEWPWGYRENEPLGGFDPYSSSKACAELVTAAYRSSYFNENQVAIGSARAGNVIGGGDWSSDRLIPDFIRAIENDRPLLIRNPNAIRPWQHVLEPLRGYLALAEALYTKGHEFASAWNFGPEETDAHSVGWVVEMISRYWGGKIPYKVDQSPQPHEATYLKLDSSKAKIFLDWHPQIRLEKALKATTEWYQRVVNGEDARAVTLEQIRDLFVFATEDAAGQT